jgi:histone acetyltransferase (RNA polymerase elongator complex component)
LLDQRTRKPLIVPIFIPFQGCPQRCVYCEQEKITDQPVRPLDRAVVEHTLEMAIRSARYNPGRGREIAFYGGTFTGLPLERMLELLRIVAPYIQRRLFNSIRISTRPDAVDVERLKVLKKFSVSTVELGTQSMNDQVLALAKRGHTAEDTLRAVRLLREFAFQVGIQLMPGLPGDSEITFRETVEEVVRLRPDMVRLYPTLVIRGTELAEWHKEGKYQPLQLEEAVSICRCSCKRLEGAGVPVIRIGLMSSPSLMEKGQIVAGPWHEAFGHLVRSEIHFEKILSYLPKNGELPEIRLQVPPTEVSLVRGHKNDGLRRIESVTGAKVVEVCPDPSVPSGYLRVKKL